ncbi:MAG: hypothetical protein AAFR73_11110 [Pseudomonadota bacterium]
METGKPKGPAATSASPKSEAQETPAETAERPDANGADDTPDRTCVFCGAEMKNDARLCPNCDRWQFPGSWLVSQLSLGDVALYGSIVVVLWSSFNVALTGRRAKLDATPLACSGHTAEVYLGNSGTSQGVLVSAAVTPVGDANEGKAYSAEIAHSGEGARLSLAPDSNEIIKVSMPSGVGGERGDFALEAADLSNCSVKLEIEAIYKSDGSTTTVQIPKACKCSDFRMR